MIEIKNEMGHGTFYYTVSELAKLLGLKDDKGYYIGRNKMYSLLRKEKILMDNNYPYQYFIGLDLVIMHKVVKGNYTIFMPIFSMRGVNYLRKRLVKEEVK